MDMNKRMELFFGECVQVEYRARSKKYTALVGSWSSKVVMQLMNSYYVTEAELDTLTSRLGEHGYSLQILPCPFTGKLPGDD